MNENILTKYYLKPGVTTSATVTNKPALGGAAHPTGHQYIDRNTGIVYTNIGTALDNIHTDGFVTRYSLEERFTQVPLAVGAFDLNSTFSDTEAQAAIFANKNFVLSGTAAAAADVTASTTGGIAIATHGGATDTTIIGTSTTAPMISAWGTVLWNTTDELRFEAVIKTGAAITTEAIVAGLKLTSTSTTATDDDQTFFRYGAASEGTGHTAAVWECINSNTGTDQIQSSGVTVAVSTTYHLLIQVGTDSVPRYYINGVLVATGNALKTASSGANLLPFIGIYSVSVASAKSMIIRQVKLSKTLT